MNFHAQRRGGHATRAWIFLSATCSAWTVVAPTWGANASDPQITSYRGLMTQWLREKYPSTAITFYDAAIGGTGSQLGMFRMACPWWTGRNSNRIPAWRDLPAAADALTGSAP